MNRARYIVINSEYWGEQWHAVSWCHMGSNILRFEGVGATRDAALRELADKVEQEEKRLKEVDNETSL